MKRNPIVEEILQTYLQAFHGFYLKKYVCYRENISRAPARNLATYLARNEII